MGVEYYIGCRKCGDTRIVSKIAALALKKVVSRKDASEYDELVKKNSFRAGLIVSFMMKHIGHDCYMYSDHDVDFGRSDDTEDLFLNGAVNSDVMPDVPKVE